MLWPIVFQNFVQIFLSVRNQFFIPNYSFRNYNLRTNNVFIDTIFWYNASDKTITKFQNAWSKNDMQSAIANKLNYLFYSINCERSKFKMLQLKLVLLVNGYERK